MLQLTAKTQKSAPSCWYTYFVRSKHSRKKYVSHVELLTAVNYKLKFCRKGCY